MAVFPVLADLKGTLQNWSPKLAQVFKQLQETDKRYRLNEEVETGETWINGRTIYRKVIDFGGVPTSGKVNVDHGITGSSYFVRISGMIDNDSEYFELNGVGGSLDIVVTQTTVAVNNSSGSYGGRRLYIVLEYVK